MMQVDWLAFLHVFVVAMGTAVIVVFSYALGLRLLVTADAGLSAYPPLGDGGDDTEAETRRMRQSPPKPPRAELSPRAKFWARTAAYACFAVCAAAVLVGIALLVIGV